jgi:hypothetical protein
MGSPLKQISKKLLDNNVLAWVVPIVLPVLGTIVARLLIRHRRSDQPFEDTTDPPDRSVAEDVLGTVLSGASSRRGRGNCQR